MTRLIHSRLVCILLVIIVLLCSLITPKPAHAWSAVEISAEGGTTSTDSSLRLRIYNIFIDFLDFFRQRFSGTKSVPVTLDKGTHQLMLNLAYQRLERDPAYQDQKEFFPIIDDILGWEGVLVNPVQVIFEGGTWRDPKRGGPDAKDKSNDSEHYYNPITKNGAAPATVQEYFRKLLEQMYSQGDFYNRKKPNDDINHFAAWSAHYLADVYVPYHTVGIPVTNLRPILLPYEAGPDYLYQPELAKLKDGIISPDSIVPPPEDNGLNGNFSEILSYYKSGSFGSEKKDWFDPWYYNGMKGMGPNTVIGSHQWWEKWAHTEITTKKLYRVPDSYSIDWQNASPGFGKTMTAIENQAAQARAFTIAAALETANNMPTYTKLPDIAFNNAVQRIATMWRASLTALRPSIQVIPDASNPKLLRVKATIENVEPTDPAKNVQAKLTAEGGKVRGSDTQPCKDDVTPRHPGSLDWEVDAVNPDSCKLRLEVTCTYEHTPDLQYAVAEPNQNRMTVEATPSSVRAGDKVKLTVKVQPAAKTQLTITDWGPLNSESADVTTDSGGLFTKEYTVSKTAKDKMYTIQIRAPKLDLTGSASIGVGLNIRNCEYIDIRFADGVTPIFTSTSKEGKKGLPFSGYFERGDSPHVKITGWEGAYTLNGTMMGNPNDTGNLTGNLKVTFDATYQTITSFKWEYKYQSNKATLPYDMKTTSMTITGSGLRKGDFVTTLPHSYPDFYYKLTGDEVGRNLKVQINITKLDGSKLESNQITCTPNAICDFLFMQWKPNIGFGN